MKIHFDSIRSSAGLLAKAALLTALVVFVASCSDGTQRPMSSQVPQTTNIMHADGQTYTTSPVNRNAPAPMAYSDKTNNDVALTAQQPQTTRPPVVSPANQMSAAPSLVESPTANAPRYSFPPTGAFGIR